MKPFRVVQLVTVPETFGFFDGALKCLSSIADVVLISGGEEAQLRRRADREHCRWAHIAIGRKIAPLDDLLAVFKMSQYFVRSGIDVVHAHTPKAVLLGMISSYLAGVPIRVCHIHGFPFETARGAKWLLLWFCDFVGLHLATHRIAVGKGVRGIAENSGLTMGLSIEVIGSGSACGIDAQTQFTPALVSESNVAAQKREVGISTTAIVVGFVGRIATDKGIAELYRAFTQLASDVEAVLLVVGGGGILGIRSPPKRSPLCERTRVYVFMVKARI